VPLLTKLRKED